MMIYLSEDQPTEYIEMPANLTHDIALNTFLKIIELANQASGLGAELSSRAVVQATRVYRMMSEPHLHYHVPHHPYEMFMAAETLRSQLTLDEYVALCYSILYHDAIVKIGREKNWNEEASAQLLERDMRQLLIAEEIIDLSATAIRATAHHTLEGVPKKQHFFVGLLLDLDLMRLGNDREYVEADTELNWLEFQCHCTKEEFAQGRAVWAENFLKTRDGGRIFHTEHFSRLEGRARKNLERLAATTA